MRRKSNGKVNFAQRGNGFNKSDLDMGTAQKAPFPLRSLLLTPTRSHKTAKQPRRQRELPWPRGSRPRQSHSALQIKERGAEGKKAGFLLLQRRKKGGGCAEARASWKSYSGIPRETEAGGCWMERNPQQSTRDSGQRLETEGAGPVTQ